MDALEETLPEEQDFAITQIIALFVLVIMAYASMFFRAYSQSSQPFTPIEITVIVGLGILYTLLVMAQDQVMVRFPYRITPPLYFLSAYALCLAIMVLTDFDGQIWLIILPILGGAADFGVWPMVWVSLLALFTVNLGIWIVSGEFQIMTSLFVTPAIVFVCAFSWISVRERETRLKIGKLAGDLSEANRQLAEYADEVESLTVVRERNRMAREIHDSLGHYLTVVNVQIGAARAVMDQNPEKAQAALEKAQKLTQEGLKDVRQSVGMLREGQEDKHLRDTLPELVEIARASGIEIDYQSPAEWPSLSPKLNRAIYRTIQEGLTNIRKHSDATHGRVIVSQPSGPDQIRIEVTDNGRGADAPEGGFGLIGMRERIQLLNGTMRIDTALGSGFQLQVDLPIPDQHSQGTAA